MEIECVQGQEEEEEAVCRKKRNEICVLQDGKRNVRKAFFHGAHICTSFTVHTICPSRKSEKRVYLPLHVLAPVHKRRWSITEN